MKGSKSKLIKYGPTIMIFFAVLGVFITANKNSYGFYTFKNSTFFLSNHSLYKINHKDYSSLREGDNVYYYEKSGNKYVIRSDKLIFKGATDSKPVYVLASKPDEVVLGERIVGKLALKSSVLGILSMVLTSRIVYFLFLILPLMLLMTYRFYNVITLPGERKVVSMPVKLSDNFVPLPKLRKRSQILTRAQRPSMQKGFS